MLDSVQNLREPIGPEVSCIYLLKGTGLDILLEACKIEATCNNHEAGV